MVTNPGRKININLRGLIGECAYIILLSFWVYFLFYMRYNLSHNLVLPFPNYQALLLVCFFTCIVAFTCRCHRIDAFRRLAGWKNILRKMPRYLKMATLETCMNPDKDDEYGKRQDFIFL